MSQTWLFRRDRIRHVLGILIPLALLSTIAAPQTIDRGEIVNVIVQGVPDSDLASIVARYGPVSRELDVIGAVVAAVPAGKVSALERAPGVTRVWVDAPVQTSDSADPGTSYAPASGVETKRASFDLKKVSLFDGDKDAVDDIPLNEISPHVYQTYTFAPAVDPSHLPGEVSLRFAFKEKNLARAVVKVYQASSRIWHPFEMDTHNTNDTLIDTTFDLSSVLVTPEDWDPIQVRFYAARNDGGEKAEVDLVSLLVAQTAHAPVSGAETTRAGLDLAKISNLDGDRDNMDNIPCGEIDPHTYQAYTFVPAVDPSDLPGVVDLRFVFKEKSLGWAQVQVYQASTQTWHPFEMDTHSTNDQFIDATLDLSGVLETPQDFAQIDVRFFPARNEGGEKAEVDLVSLRLAALVGDTTLDMSQVFEAINAAPVWAAGITGAGVGIAVLDSGAKKYKELEKDIWGQKTGYVKGWSALTGKADGDKDKNGHGTLVASIVSNSKRQGETTKYYGVSPNSRIIPVQVLDTEGKGRYSDVIAGLAWAIEHKKEYNIRVINLSLSARPQSLYWEDPLNQAVMHAWQEGIVVVVAAGNSGPDPMTIGVPGNVPYVITVGAITDAYTPTDWSDDYVPEFSAAGPTYEGFVKPDLVAPGGHIVGLLSDKCKMAQDHPKRKVDKDYYQFSGTSMSAAQVSGVIALMLDRDPTLTPDQVKYRLLASARPAFTPDGMPAFGPWQQGAGRVDAYAAVYGAFAGEANQGLDLGKDLAGTEHYVGHTRWDSETGSFYLLGSEDYLWGGGFAWSESYLWGGGFAWSESYAWGDGFAWSEGYLWGGGFAWSESYAWGDGFAWSENYTWGDGFAWSEATAGIDVWTDQE